VIKLRPYLRLFRADGQAMLESVLAERAVPLDDAMLAVLRALSRGPVRSSSELDVDFPRGEVNGRLSLLHGLGLISTAAGGEPPPYGAFKVDQPIIDQVELTNICPMQCVMCPTGTGRMTRHREHMSRELFERVVDEAVKGPRTKPLTLHNLGESLLHPQLAEFVKLASDRGLQTEVAGNPGHLNFDLYRALEDAGLTRLVLDVDGTDRETLEAIRGKGARGDRAFENLEHVLSWRRERPREYPRIVLQMIRQDRNSAQHQTFVERYARRDITGVEAYLKEVDANTVEAGPLRIFQELRPRRPYLCRAPWRSVVVLVNGDVVPCCHDANGAVVYGNLKEKSLADIWAGDVVKALRERMAQQSLTKGEPCDACAHRADRYPLPNLDEIPEEPLHW
jgi:radical SAM protein with 4Fe4S-binding SPASM domain